MLDEHTVTSTRPPMNPLQQLIRTRMTSRHWSYSDVARRGALPRSTVHHLATTERLIRPPHPTTLAGLSRGLDIPIDAVRVAAAAAAGLAAWSEPTIDPEIEILVAALTKLGPDERRHVQALVESLLDGQQPSADGDTPGPRDKSKPARTSGS
jgi:transcriptional regulator with XRE-family HTH domain